MLNQKTNALIVQKYSAYKLSYGFPQEQDNCLYFIHFLLEQDDISNGVVWEPFNQKHGYSFRILDKIAFASKYGILSFGKSIPKYDSIRRLLNNYAFHCVC